MAGFELIAAGVLGLAIGSFLATCADRLPLDRSLLRPGSTCPNCGSPIPKYDLIPVLSYLLLGGRARCCHSRISARYPLIEIITALIFMGLIHRYGPGWDFFVGAVFASFLIVVSVIDLDYRLIFNKMTYPAMVLALLAALIGHAGLGEVAWDVRLARSLMGAGGMYLFFRALVLFGRVLLKGDVMGEGDVKLSVVIGAFFGPYHVAGALLAGFVVAGFMSLLLLVAGRVGLKSHTAFGPYLAAGALFILLRGF